MESSRVVNPWAGPGRLGRTVRPGPVYLQFELDHSIGQAGDLQSWNQEGSLERIKNLKLGPHCVWVVGYPKTGSHFVQVGI